MSTDRAAALETQMRAALKKVLAETGQRPDVLAFRLIEDAFFVFATDITKVTPLPEYTLIPGAKPWVLGVAKDRDGLFPVIDMGVYAYGVTALRGKTTAGVLLAMSPGGRVGLLVSEIVGLRKIGETTKAQATTGSVNAILLRDALCSCVMEDEKWHLIDLAQLLNNPTFQNLNLD